MVCSQLVGAMLIIQRASHPETSLGQNLRGDEIVCIMQVMQSRFERCSECKHANFEDLRTEVVTKHSLFECDLRPTSEHRDALWQTSMIFKTSSTHSSTSSSVLPSKLDVAALLWPGFMQIPGLALRGAEQ